MSNDYILKYESKNDGILGFAYGAKRNCLILNTNNSERSLESIKIDSIYSSKKTEIKKFKKEKNLKLRSEIHAITSDRVDELLFIGELSGRIRVFDIRKIKDRKKLISDEPISKCTIKPDDGDNNYVMCLVVGMKNNF